MSHDDQFLTRYRNGIRTSIRNNAAAYGYSVVVTSDFALLAHFTAPAGPLEVYLFIFGAVAGFALLELITSRMYQERQRGETSDVVALGTAFSVVSISAAVGMTTLIAWLIDNWAAWPLSAFGSTVAYLLLLALELALAERLEEHA